MRSTISLDARIFDSGKRPPVAPPRKRKTLKKGSTLPTTFSEQKVKNGFKDVFGNSSLNTYDEIEYIDKDENLLGRSMPQMTSTPEKKLRVGNKKSDKFFGEELSDRLSDEPVTPTTRDQDEIDAVKSETDKKLSFFLMNMLDDIRDQVEKDRYRGKEPIEEPLFVARKKITKHICDDDDDDHHHHHEKGNVAPPKPDRDFSKFKSDSIESQIEKEVKVDDLQAKAIIRRGISRENLPSPPETPRRKTGNNPTITIETIELNMTERRDDFEDFKKSNESIKEQIESNSHKITNMVDEMIKKAYGIGGFNIEDCSHHTHDELVTPTSKLAVRKISTSRKNSTESSPSIEGEVIKAESPPKVIQKEDKSKMDNLVEESHRKFDEIDEAARVPKSSVKIRNDEPIAAKASSMNDIIDEIYNRNSEIMKEFQSFLEQSIENSPIIDVEQEKKFVDRKEVMENFTAQIVAENEELLDDELDNRRYSDSFESTDEEQHDNAKRMAFAQAAKKRSSIKDCDNWFSHHVEREETESDVCNNVRDLERPPSGYDHNKIFPFGRTITGRRDSLSDEFFTDVINTPLIKLAISTVRESESSVSDDGLKEEDEIKPRDERSNESPDHSVLFKYIDKSANETIIDDKK
jgi:hypothetical protein